MPRLAGKMAFITGAGTGIGRATAILFAREGAKVAIAEIDARAGEETAHLAGNEAIAIRADVTDPDSLQAVAFEEYRLRRRAGQTPNPQDYARRYGPRPESAAWQDNSNPFS